MNKVRQSEFQIQTRNCSCQQTFWTEMFSSGVAKGSPTSKLPKYSTSRGPLDRSKRPWFISLLVAVKVCSSLTIFMLADFLGTYTRGHDRHHVSSPVTSDGLLKASSSSNLAGGSDPGGGGGGILGQWGPIYQTLAFIQLISGAIYVTVQNPVSKKKGGISPLQWLRIFRHSAVLILLMFTWICGLLMSGPFRTVLVSAHYDYTLAGIVSGIFFAKTGSRLRGGVLFAAGLLVLFLFDEGNVVDEQRHHRPTRSTHDEVEDKYMLSRVSAGILTLTCYLIFKLGFDALSKSLAVDIGSKRLHALTTIVSGVILWLLVFIDLISGGELVAIWSNFFSLVFIVLFGFVMNYYVDSICMKRMDTWEVARIGTSASHFSAFLYSLIWISLNEVPNVATLLSFALIYLGSWSLTNSERASGGGTLVGFSTDGLPLFNFSNLRNNESRSQLWKNCIRLGFSFYKQIQEDAMSRRIFYYFVLTVGFTSVEFLYGAITNSLGLISDGFHMLFDSMAIFIGLFASVVGRWKPNSGFPFGYGRVEILSGFLNAFFLLVVAGAIFVEAISRMFSPPSVDAHQTLTISIIGLIVNLIGIYIFRNTSLEHVRVHENANIRGVFLHVLADTMGSIGVICSSLLIKHFRILVADPLCSLVIATLIASTAWPLLKDTARVLLLSVPSGLERNLQQIVLQLLAAEGVKGYKTLRFWAHAPQILTGSIHIQATKDANEQQIIRHVNNLFSSIGFSHFTTQVEKDEFVARRNLTNEEDLLDPINAKSLAGIEIVGIGPEDLNSSDSPLLQNSST